MGGCLTGEHGVGIEKRDLMVDQYAPADLEAQMAVKDVFDPELAAEPGQGVSAGGVAKPRRVRAGGGIAPLGAAAVRTPGIFADQKKDA